MTGSGEGVCNFIICWLQVIDSLLINADCCCLKSTPIIAMSKCLEVAPIRTSEVPKKRHKWATKLREFDREEFPNRGTIQKCCTFARSDRKKHERKKKRLMELLKMFFFCVLRKVGKVFHFVFIQRHDYFFLPCTMVFMCIYALRGYSSFSLRLLVCTLDWIA